jgi:UDP-3-O-[3-hydroxymyristoyl] glucosamine N-acyltransferase
VRLTLSELALLTGGDIVRGEPSAIYDGIAALDDARPSEISFLGNEKYKVQFLATSAGVVLVPQGVTAGPTGSVALIAAENPSLAFELAVKHFLAASRRFQPGIHPRAMVDETARLGSVWIHPGAVIMAGAEIGDGTEIGPNAVIGENVRIGRDCQIHSCVTIRDRCVLGDRVILHPGVVIGADGYGYAVVDGRHEKLEQLGIVEIHDDVEIGANTTVDRARFGRTIIGEGTKIDNLVQIAHNVRIGKHNLIVSQAGIAGSSHTGDYVVVGGQVGMVGHVKIGDRAIMAARTGVNRDLEGGIVYGGTPAQPLIEDQRQQVLIRRLPELVKRVKALEKQLMKIDDERKSIDG